MDGMYRILIALFVSFMLVQRSVSQQDASSSPVPAPSLADPSTTTTPSPAYTACINACQTVQHYNPVCGSDGVTYNNEFRLNCARRCGQQVVLVRGGSCVSL